jgi:hypothetical protein
LDLPKLVTNQVLHLEVVEVVTLLPTIDMDHLLLQETHTTAILLDRLLVVILMIVMEDPRLVIIHHLATMVHHPLEVGMALLLLVVTRLHLVSQDTMMLHHLEVDMTISHPLLVDMMIFHHLHQEADTMIHHLPAATSDRY